MCEPAGHGSLQRSLYSGHEIFHCLIYQTITTSDGLMLYLHGPEVGRLHNMTVDRQSGLGSILEEHLMIGGIQYCIYGDAAYILRSWLQTAYPTTTATPAQLAYNKRMSAF